MFARITMSILNMAKASPMMMPQPTAGIATYYRWKNKMKNHKRAKARKKLRFRSKKKV
jgi:hypothetical protein